MKNIIICFLLISTATIVSQQKYRVTYDFQTEEINYYKLDKLNNIEDTLSSPKFKRNSLIELKLINVNPFAVSIETDVKEETIHPKMSGFNFSSLLGNVNSLSGESLNLNVADENSFLSRGGNAEGAKSRGAKLNDQFSSLNKLTSTIDAIEASFMANLTNPNINKEQILDNLKDASFKIKNNKLTNNPKENFYSFLYNLDNIVKEDTKALENEISSISSEIDQSLNSETPMSRGQLVQTNNTFKNLDVLRKSLSAKQSNTSESLNKIKNLYSNLEASNFEQTYDYIIEADKVDIVLKFLQSELVDPGNSEAEASLIKTRSLKLFSKGGFKINTSVALTLNNFGDKSKEFYIDDNDVIGADIGNGSTPNLSTMINFYPVMGENFNIGGSFGVSIPISGEARGINFLLGPTIFLGSKSRLSLSGGVAYGTVNRLKNGLEVGDTTTITDIDSFTKQVYDFGYYFGISFSLFEIK